VLVIIYQPEEEVTSHLWCMVCAIRHKQYIECTGPRGYTQCVDTENLRAARVHCRSCSITNCTVTIQKERRRRHA